VNHGSGGRCLQIPGTIVLFFDHKPPAEKTVTRKLCIHDLRTNKHFTLKENPLKEEH
jgi:type I restriction enzyme M protein